LNTSQTPKIASSAPVLPKVDNPKEINFMDNEVGALQASLNKLTKPKTVIEMLKEK